MKKELFASIKRDHLTETWVSDIILGGLAGIWLAKPISTLRIEAKLLLKIRADRMKSSNTV